MFNRNNIQTKIKNLWEWFEKNYEALFNEDDSVKIEFITNFIPKLREIHPSIVYELGIDKKADKPFLVIISADGIISAFPIVLDIVKAAPILESVQIKAFRQPKNIKNMEIEIEDKKLTSDKLTFTHFKDWDKKDQEEINLNVYVSDFEELTEEIKQAIFLFLDATIGEFYVGTKIGRIGMGLISEYEAHDIESKLKPLAELKKIVKIN